MQGKLETIPRRDYTMNDFSKTLQLLADETRFHIIRMLGAGPATVTELVDGLGLGQSLVSYHLSVMKDAGVVRITTKGKWRIYSLNASVDRNTKTLVELITGSELDRDRGRDTSTRKELADAIPQDDERVGATTTKATPSRDRESGKTPDKPKVEDFEDYLL